MTDTQTEPEVVEQTDAPPADAPPEPEQQPEWAQRFDNPDTMWKSYRESEAAKTRAEQRAAELERQQQEYEAQQQAYQDPWDALPPTVDEHTQQQLAAWAERDPSAAAQWAYQNHHQVGPEIAGYLFQYWASRDFWGAENWKAQIINAQSYDQMRQEIRSEFEPVRQHTTQQMSQLTIDLAQRSIPDWEAWAPRIVEFLEQPENQVWRQAIDAAGLGSEGAAERLYDIYAVLHARQNRSAATSTPAPPPPPNAQTETTSTSPGRDEQGRFASSTTTTTPTSGRKTGRLDHL